MTRNTRGGAGAVLALALGGLTPAAAQSFSPEEIARLQAGEVVAWIIDDGGAAGRLGAAVDIPAPPATVWRVMLDCERAPAFVPGLERCTVLSRALDGLSDEREHRVRWLSILPRLTLRFRSTYAPHREIRISRTGGDLSTLEGTWRLFPLGSGATRLTYDVRMAPGGPVPRAWVRSGLLRDTPKVLEAVRTEALRVQGGG